MSGADSAENRAEAERWLAIAIQDISAARACLGVTPPLNGVAAYHCQQATEKISKALLVAAGRDFPKTHDLTALTALVVSVYPALAPVLSQLDAITVWGLAYRYPSEEEGEHAPAVDEISRRIGEIEALHRRAAAAIQGSD
jgi:HEPN domain-containing protein